MSEEVDRTVVDRPAWSGMAESGSVAALQVMAWLYRRFGRRFCSLLLYPIAAYFFVMQGAVRRASLDYLETLWSRPEGRRALGRAPRWRDALHHIHEFAVNVFDRMVLWAGTVESFDIRHSGKEHMLALETQRRGAILVGAHIGSFDVARLLAKRYDLPLNVLMFTQHAQQITSFLERLDPRAAARVIQLEPGSMRAVFDIKACLDRGELVAVLGDRLAPGGHEPAAVVDFLGRPAAFPLSPYRLAGVLGCPILSCICVRTGDAAYEVSVEPLGRGVPVPRKEREAEASRMLERYVRILESCCFRVPYQWFNFYDFWSDPSHRAEIGA